MSATINVRTPLAPGLPIGILLRLSILERIIMAIEAKPGQTLRVTINKRVSNEAARKTLERLFMKDKGISGPIALRSRNFIPLPKRRGGCIWTKYPNKVHPVLEKGVAASVTVTPQSLRDLNSVEKFVEIAR
jgi:hypothetical protein